MCSRFYAFFQEKIRFDLFILVHSQTPVGSSWLRFVPVCSGWLQLAPVGSSWLQLAEVLLADVGVLRCLLRVNLDFSVSSQLET